MELLIGSFFGSMIGTVIGILTIAKWVNYYGESDTQHPSDGPTE